MAANQDRILVVDDSESTLQVLERNLKSQGYAVFTATNVAQAIELLENMPIDLVVTDMRMPKIGGLDLVRHVRSNHPAAGVIMITGFASIDSAVSAIREGAEDYLPKPFTDDELLAAVGGALRKVHHRRTANAPAAQAAQQPKGLIGTSAAMK